MEITLFEEWDVNVPVAERGYRIAIYRAWLDACK
jgi:hypothetical protein